MTYGAQPPENWKAEKPQFSAKEKKAMTTDEKKPLEFYVCRTERLHGSSYCVFNTPPNPEEYDGVYVAVEKSELDAANAETAQLKEKLRVAREALLYLQTKGCDIVNGSVCEYKSNLANKALAQIDDHE